MDEYKSKSWRIMADYGCGLWDDRGYGTGPDDDEINAPAGYVERFEAWVDKYHDNLEGALDLDSFDKEGRALAAELKKIVGPDISPLSLRHAGAGRKFRASWAQTVRCPFTFCFGKKWSEKNTGQSESPQQCQGLKGLQRASAVRAAWASGKHPTGNCFRLQHFSTGLRFFEVQISGFLGSERCPLLTFANWSANSRRSIFWQRH